MSQLFQPRADAIFRFVLWCVCLGALTTLVTVEGLSHSEYLTGRNMVAAQPTEFSHQHHAGELGIDCRYCHTSVETAATAGMPPTHTCMTCHSQVWTGARMLAPVRDSLSRNQPLTWQRVGRLPEYVYFAHSVHIANGIGCSSCHGDIDQHADDLSAACFFHGFLSVMPSRAAGPVCGRRIRFSICSGNHRPIRRSAAAPSWHNTTSIRPAF